MADTYNYFVTSSGNKIWAGALTLAWKEFKQSFADNESLKFNGTDEFSDKIAKNYNNARFSRNDLEESSYYIHSGFGQATVDKINKEVKRKFPERSMQDLEVSLSDEEIISYAYFFKKFEYVTPFQKDSSFYFDGKKCDGFTATDLKQKNQLYYKYYKSSE